jgi:hypothetical protein
MRTATLPLTALLLTACPKGDGDETAPPVDTQPGDTHDSAPPAGDPCTELGLPLRPFEDAASDDGLYATAADFTVPTRGGDWTLSEHWTGCDVILMIQDAPNQARGWPTDLWARDVGELFEKLPRNTQLLFMSTGTSTTAIDESLDELEAEIGRVIADMDPADATWWQGRVSYVTQRAQIIDGWVGDIMNDPGWGVGIDRTQRIRYIGSYADPTRYNASYGWFEPNLSYAANEAVHYNFEAEREAELEAQGALVIEVFDGSDWASSFTQDVEIPSADTLAAYDTLELDLHMGCGGEGEYGDCFAWDTGARLLVCDQSAEASPWADTACQPAVDEVMGSCSEDGVATKTACRSAEDCGADTGIDYACEGYAEAIAADTQEGACEDPMGGATTGTYTCNDEGTGYGELACSCDSEHELGRWITTYHREGRWVHDVTSLRQLLTPGETERLYFLTGSNYTVDLDLRFSSSDRQTEPEELTHLFAGCNLASDCNASYEGGVAVEIPADAAKVQLATIITGHGMSNPGNCAEFCDMDHIFSIGGDDALTVEFDVEGTDYRCEDEVNLGTVPNQYGTWWYSRHGWCPGREVAVQLHDITEQVALGAENQFDYRVLYRGADYEPEGGASIWANVWLVVER